MVIVIFELIGEIEDQQGAHAVKLKYSQICSATT